LYLGGCLLTEFWCHAFQHGGIRAVARGDEEEE
jgi:hypothetical protein